MAYMARGMADTHLGPKKFEVDAGAHSYIDVTDYSLSPETEFALRTNTRPSPYFGMTADAIRKLAHDRHVSMMKDIDELTDNDGEVIKRSSGIGKFIESRRTLTEASEMLGLGTPEYTEHLKNYWVNHKSGRMHVGDVVDAKSEKVPVIMTGAAAAIVAHYAGYPEGGDIIEDLGHESPLGLAPTCSARCSDEPKASYIEGNTHHEGRNFGMQSSPIFSGDRHLTGSGMQAIGIVEALMKVGYVSVEEDALKISVDRDELAATILKMNLEPKINKLGNYAKASEMMGFGKGQYESDIGKLTIECELVDVLLNIKELEHKFALGLVPTGSARSPDEPKPERVRKR